MKKIIYIIMIGVLSVNCVIAQDKLMEKELVKPDYYQFSSQIGNRANKLKEMLKQRKWKDFYSSIHQLFNEINNMDREIISAEDFNDFMWCFYLVCKAPFYEVYYTTDFHGKDDDISAKTGVASFIASFNVNIISKKTGIETKFIKRLNSLYFSTIVKSFCFQHDLNEKIKLNRKNIYKRNNEIEIESDNYSILERRDNIFRNRLSPFLEKQLVEMLIEYFPGNSSEVFKYIKIAGYENSDISGLIDRTVGLNSNTQFLYKGRIGQEHKKRIKMYLKNKNKK